MMYLVEVPKFGNSKKPQRHKFKVAASTDDEAYEVGMTIAKGRGYWPRILALTPLTLEESLALK